MRLMTTARLSEGARLGRDVMLGRPDGIPLLRAGVAITARYRQQLIQAGVNAVYIEDRESEGIVPEPLVSDETRAVATRAVAGAHQSATNALRSGRPLAPAAIEGLKDIVARILREIQESGGIAVALADLSTADAYTMQHSIDVTALGLLIGQRYFRERGWTDYQGVVRFDRVNERLTQMGLGLLLHDIGKLTIPVSLLNKPGKLTPGEWNIMQSHPRAGIDLLAGPEWSPLIKAVVLRHHERCDGTGYPDGKLGSEIHEMARIAAVADVYDAITSDRVYAAARPAATGVRVILEGSGGIFDEDVVGVFAKLVAPFPPGDELTLEDGRRAVVVSVPEQALDRPVIRILDGPGAPSEISLQHHPAVRIAGWDPVPAAAAA
jgi:HD-GYP domain-containing protein (c-di-GMP phosphodiesterase class II)